MTAAEHVAGADLLLVDDEQANLLALEAILHDLGANLFKARSGEEALRFLLERDFAVILLDVKMHPLDGFETAKLIRSRKKSRSTPIIFLTAYDDNRLSIEQAYALGAVDYLVKPIVPIVLRAKVRGFLELFEKRREVEAQAERLRQLDRREFEQKLADENARLRAAERRFRALIENSSDGIGLLDADGVLRFVTSAVTRILGYSGEELVGRDGLEQLHPGDVPAVRSQWQQLLDEPGGRRVAQYRARHKDGSWRWIERVATNLLAEPSVAAVISNFRDISERKRLEEHALEMRLARRIQQRLLPTALPDLAGFDIGGAFHPAGETGGDYFDFLPLDGGVGLAIGDVSGHDLGAALVMARTQASLRALGQGFRNNGRRASDDLGRLVSILNRALAGDLSGDFFVTLMLGRLDLATRELVCVGAGHPAGYVLDAAGKVKSSLASEGVPLGITAEAEFPAGPAVTLEPGDLLLLLTDGIVEACAPDGTFFGAQRAVDIVRVYRRDPAARIVENLYQAVRAFTHAGPQADDITAIVVKVPA